MIDNKLKDFILNLIPEINNLADDKNMSEEEKFYKLVEYSQDPEISKKINEYLKETFLYSSKENDVVKVNPLYSAAVAEQLQFDEDIPELRAIPLPKNVKPAVPVITESRNIVLIGKMLEYASEETLKKIEEKNEELKNKMIGIENNPLVPVDKKTEMILSMEKEYGMIEEYMPQREATPMVVTNITAKDILGLTKEEETLYTWKVIATRHGRKSLCSVLEKNLFLKLNDFRFKNFLDNSKNVKITYQLSIMDFGHLNPEFDFVESILLHFEREIRKIASYNEEIGICVRVFNDYPQRLVGWTCYVNI